MPIDLAATLPHLIRVRDHAGGVLPFSRGLMATSILGTGAATDLAYAIATEIQQHLLRTGARDVETAELTELAASVIATRGGARLAARYRAWRTARRDARPLFIVLGGAPGIGKSTVATRMAVRLGITRIVTTDTIREVLRTVIPAAVLPELHGSTYEVAGEGTHPAEGYQRQARVVCNAVVAVVRRLLAERRSAIIEGVHVLPGELQRGLEGSPGAYLWVEALLTLEDEATHLRNLRARSMDEPGRGGVRSLARFTTIRSIQAWLCERAGAAGIERLDLGDPRRLTERLLDLVYDQAEAADP